MKLYRFSTGKIGWLVVKVGDVYWTPHGVRFAHIRWFGHKRIDFKGALSLVKDSMILDNHEVRMWKLYLKRYGWLLISPVSHKYLNDGTRAVDTPTF